MKRRSCKVRKFKPTGKWYATGKSPVCGSDVVQWGDTEQEAKENLRKYLKLLKRSIDNGKGIED